MGSFEFFYDVGCRKGGLHGCSLLTYGLGIEQGLSLKDRRCYVYNPTLGDALRVVCDGAGAGIDFLFPCSGVMAYLRHHRKAM
ncbi:hypothetical protein DSLASN_23810 [Desulfoluna limicola]|uniref:Uncharacterized protein n=1 Tax=Desulfoluna limicola TaxID=2810562 RepID=A0ABM7PHS1_9BACT|nr:hypothetical protein DSLASN_23810 [Desulfoluna limicola]